MPDICDLILDDHEQFRRRFAELDERRAAGADPAVLAGLWEPLAGMLERHAEAEERLFYPRLLQRGENAEEETDDALHDHNGIRDAVRRALAAPVGEKAWWEAVEEARSENSDHIAEEEREALPDFRLHADPELRDELGEQWQRFAAEHPDGAGLTLQDKDPQEYLRRHE